jgi:hypothetical protein
MTIADVQVDLSKDCHKHRQFNLGAAYHGRCLSRITFHVAENMQEDFNGPRGGRAPGSASAPTPRVTLFRARNTTFRVRNGLFRQRKLTLHQRDPIQPAEYIFRMRNCFSACGNFNTGGSSFRLLKLHKLRSVVRE